MGDNVRNTRSVCCGQTDYINVNDYKASMLGFHPMFIFYFNP